MNGILHHLKITPFTQKKSSSVFQDWIEIPSFAFEMLGKSAKHIIPNGGETWCFTMKESKEHLEQTHINYHGT